MPAETTSSLHVNVIVDSALPLAFADVIAEPEAAADTVQQHIRDMALAARAAARDLATTTGAARNAALEQMAACILAKSSEILSANAQDLAQAKADGLAPAMLGRLTLSEAKIQTMAAGIRQVAAQVDPVGQTIEAYDRPNGLRVEKRRTPIGVIGIIYESRPNVTSDAAALCLKSGNACILRGGKESLRTNHAIALAIHAALQAAHMNPDCVQVLTTPDRRAVTALVTAEGLVDLIIPRGGESLIRAVVAQARVPVIKHYRGVCHIYIDKDADIDMAVEVAYSAKVDGCAVCNTAECILVHKDVSARVLPRLAAKYREARVEMRADPRILGLLQDAKLATEADYGAEFLDLIVAIKQVGGLADAVAHIARYGSQHTDAIITQNIATANAFVQQVDSSSVMVNASTRFADGGEYGLGAEIGISTDKLHARGPMGAADLCTYKFVVTGNGHVRR